MHALQSKISSCIWHAAVILIWEHGMLSIKYFIWEAGDLTSLKRGYGCIHIVLTRVMVRRALAKF